MSVHTCHARGCSTPVPPKMLMCLPHWRMVPTELQREVYRTYQPGQEHGRFTPTEAWHRAADAAIQAVADKEAPQACKRCRGKGYLGTIWDDDTCDRCAGSGKEPAKAGR